MRNGLIIDGGGDKRWYLNDKRHRLDGPAVEWANGYKEWWVDGRCHRTDGPAVEWASGSKSWWFEGKWLGDNQEGFWMLWAKLTLKQQNNVNILQWWAKYTEGAK